MKQRLPLLWLALRRRRKLIVALAAGLIVFETLIVVIAAAIPTDELFNAKKVPSSFDAFSGSTGSVSLASIAGLLGAGLLHPFWIALQLSAVGSLGAAVVASDVEEGTIELVAIRPISRMRMLAERSMAIVLVALLLSFAAVIPLYFANWFTSNIKNSIDARGITIAAIAGFALVLCYAGIAIAVSCASRKKATVIAAVGGVGAVTYAANFVAEAWEPASLVKYLSPFHYYHPADALVYHQMPWSNLAVLISVAIAGTLVGAVLLQRRDLTR